MLGKSLNVRHRWFRDRGICHIDAFLLDVIFQFSTIPVLARPLLDNVGHADQIMSAAAPTKNAIEASDGESIDNSPIRSRGLECSLDD